jgi:hypothetical protein
VRLLPTETQQHGAGLQHVSHEISTKHGGWDVVMRASDPHDLAAWGAHEVARFPDTFRQRLGAADTAHYRRLALATAVTGEQLKGMSRADLAHVLHLHDPAPAKRYTERWS